MLTRRSGVSNIRPAGQNRPVARSNPARGLILQSKPTLFAWEVYPVILRLLVTRFQLLETLTQLFIFYCFSHVKFSRFLHISFCMFTPV